MAAAIVNMQQYLEEVLEINPQGKRQKFQEAGVTTLQALVRKPDDFAHKASQTIRKSNTGQPAQRDVSLEEETRIHGLVIFCRFRYMIQRPHAFGAATLDNLDEVTTWYEQLEEDPEPDTVPVFTDNCNKKEWFESITAYLANKKGKTTGFPLLYVVREQADPPEGADDPGFGGYSTFSEELVVRGRLAGHFYQSDNAAVWTFLRSKCHGTTAWTTIMSFRAARNGRGAFLALLGQFMGADAKAVLLKRAEKVLANTTFDGRNRNWTFDKFIGKLREAFMDLGPDNQLSEQRKVNKLMQAWQVQSLQHVRAIVSATPAYRDNFDACVYFLSEQLTGLQLMNQAPGRNVSLVTKNDIDQNNKQLKDLQVEIKSLQKQLNDRKSGKSGNNGKSGKDSSKGAAKKNRSDKYDPSNPTAYIPDKVWRSLDKKQIEQIRDAREKEGIPVRRVGSVQTKKRKPDSQEVQDDTDSREVGQVQNKKISIEVHPTLLQSPAASKKPAPTVPKAPTVGALKTSQRSETYSQKKAASTGKGPT